MSTTETMTEHENARIEKDRPQTEPQPCEFSWAM